MSMGAVCFTCFRSFSYSCYFHFFLKKDGASSPKVYSRVIKKSTVSPSFFLVLRFT